VASRSRLRRGNGVVPRACLIGRRSWPGPPATSVNAWLGEAGEDLLTALGREITEETGWQLRGSPQLIHVADWETDDPDEYKADPNLVLGRVGNLDGVLAFS
jgi:ADP-ribose pyrophosphatase YjhB (NUDIX family)